MENALKALRLLLNGEFLRVWREVHLRLYKSLTHLTYIPYYLIHSRKLAPGSLRVDTSHPIAEFSPDHRTPKGTIQDNSYNLGFVMAMDRLMRKEFPNWVPGMVDLGCSGGEAVANFRSLGWQAVGIEGSDRSLRMGRAQWPRLGGIALFTADITRPFSIHCDINKLQWNHTAHLITAWEVLEHIKEQDLMGVFQNIYNLLDPGGYFIASTTETSDIHEGVELHQTQWTNAQWKQWMAANAKWLVPTFLDLKPHQMVRQNFLYPSYLTYRKKS